MMRIYYCLAELNNSERIAERLQLRITKKREHFESKNPTHCGMQPYHQCLQPTHEISWTATSILFPSTKKISLSGVFIPCFYIMDWPRWLVFQKLPASENSCQQIDWPVIANTIFLHAPGVWYRYQCSNTDILRIPSVLICSTAEPIFMLQC